MNLGRLTYDQLRTIQKRVFWDQIHWRDDRTSLRFARLYQRLNNAIDYVLIREMR